VISQKKLNGKPRTTGSMRSHRDTEKQIATNGISANRIAPTDGLRTDAPCSQIPEEEDSNGGDSPSEREEGQAERLVEANLVS